MLKGEIRETLFPFLIGRMLTSNRPSCSLVKYVFPFLIGRMLTDLVKRGVIYGTK